MLVSTIQQPGYSGDDRTVQSYHFSIFSEWPSPLLTVVALKLDLVLTLFTGCSVVDCRNDVLGIFNIR